MSGYQKVYERPNAEGMYLGCVWFDGAMWIAENRATRLFYPLESAAEGRVLLTIRHRMETRA